MVKEKAELASLLRLPVCESLWPGYPCPSMAIDTHISTQKHVKGRFMEPAGRNKKHVFTFLDVTPKSFSGISSGMCPCHRGSMKNEQNKT